MGCNIHLYIEYEKSENYWQKFGNKFGLTRDYQMFGILSKGVRTNPEEPFEQKGLPDDISKWVKRENLIYISESDSERHVDLETAKRYKKHGCEIIHRNDQPTWVTHPDWHSHSWLTSDEYKEAIKRYGRQYAHAPSIEFLCVQSILNTLEDLYNARVVYWFDN